ncbi:hypothetical protein SCORR_v1c02730 [Spiroplasma corruscae]|uniref:Uncharacterized protein n=1 Tax=Spiroplasma corruscae TaxID=216934 RepID=A0A222ENJ2_9MOLU|nr:hypothetical protein [Spiroplasma corruscae]ASP28047.1 hypothetical protein SCORR_v1c02730 [Spiroplasma corruscae]
MYYTKETFWVKTGTQFIWFFATYKNIDVSIDELEDFITNKDYLNSKVPYIFNDEIINLVKAWDYIRLVVLKYKLDDQNLIKLKTLIDNEVLTTIYRLIDPNEKFIDSFDENLENKFKVKLNDLLCLLDDNDNLSEIIEKFCFYLYEFVVFDYLGEYTILFYCYFIQLVFICKDYGPVMFNDIADFNNVINLSKKIKLFMETNDKSKWKNCEELNQVETIWNDKVEFFKLIKDNF